MKLAFLFLFSVASTLSFASSGFSSDIDAAVARAKREKKPMLIDFFGIWCPPCNELDETVFDTPTFLEKSKAFVLLKVDADAKASWKIKDKYKIGGYPTIVFTDPGGKEIYRIVGYRTLKEMTRLQDLVLSAKGKDFTASCKSKNSEDLWRCATVCAERKDRACAERAFGQLEKSVKAGSPRYQDARTYFVDNAATPELKRDGYERLISELPQSPRALLWSADYVSLCEDAGVVPKKEILEKVIAAYPQSSVDPSREEMGLAPTDLAQMRALLLDKLGRNDEAKAAWKEAAQMLKKAAEDLPAGAPARGFTLERIPCLEASGQLDEALKLAQEYRAKFPTEFTFHYWEAQLLNRAKRYNEAIPIAKKAFETSYGDNRIRVGTLLVNLYATVPDRERAKEIVDKINSDMKPEAKLEIRTHRYLKALDAAFAKISGSANKG